MEQISNGITGMAPGRTPFNYDRFEQLDRNIDAAWLSLSDIRLQLNLFGDTSQDDYLTELELATRMAIEDYLGLRIKAVSYRVYYSPASVFGSPVTLDLPQTSQGGVTVISVAYYDQNNVLQTVDPAGYYYDATGQKIVVASLPTAINTNRTSPIVVEYTLEADPIGTYPVVKHAAKLLLTHLYNNRSNTSELNLKAIPYGVDTLLRPYKPTVM